MPSRMFHNYLEGRVWMKGLTQEDMFWAAGAEVWRILDRYPLQEETGLKKWPFLS